MSRPPFPVSEGRSQPSALRRVWGSPALRALAAQLLALPPMLMLTWLAARAGLAPGYLFVALLQGVLAAVLGARWQLPRWWWPIQAGFPLALLGASALALPPAWFLAGFVLLVLLYWSTFRTRVPYYPSSMAVRAAVAALLPADRPARVIDIGSGLGGLVLDLARRRPDCSVEGIEIAPLPWLAGRVRAALAGNPARLMRGDYARLDFARYDLVFAYLSPAAMDALWVKARQEMRPGSMLVSYEFPVENHPADLCQIPAPGARTLHIWHF